MASIPATLETRIRAEDLITTGTEREALARLRELTGATDGAMERHGLRCLLICDRLARRHGVEVDHELLLVAGLLHDIGLYDGASRGGVYVSDGREYAAAFLAGRAGWEGERTRICLDAIERHHELRSQWDAGAEVELLRRADLVEVTRGVVSHGAGRSWLGELWKAVPRDGTFAEIGRMVLKALRERPTTVPRAFWRGRG